MLTLIEECSPPNYSHFFLDYIYTQKLKMKQKHTLVQYFVGYISTAILRPLVFLLNFE